MIQIIHADVIDGLRQIPDQTVQCVVTSPPYWGLRDYGVEVNKGVHKNGVPVGCGQKYQNWLNEHPAKTLGWQPSCSCNADAVPCIVLDPFGGSGTVGKVARDLNRKAILIELNAEYIKIARERLRLNEQLGAFA